MFKVSIDTFRYSRYESHVVKGMVFCHPFIFEKFFRCELLCQSLMCTLTPVCQFMFSIEYWWVDPYLVVGGAMSGDGWSYVW